MITKKTSWILSFCVIAILLSSQPAVAQMQRDVRDVFRGMLEDLDPDLQEKFKDAIQRNSSSVEFTPEQFRRFRVDPANPFDGLDHIKARDSDGDILLKFELPRMRNRRVSPLERQSPTILGRVSDPLSVVRKSTVRIYSNHDHVAMGTVVDSDGWILTKASEIASLKKLRVQLPDRRELDAIVRHVDKENDLALLKIKASRLTAVLWSTRPVALGAFLLTPDVDGTVIALGTYSVGPRSTNLGEQAFLGVKPETTPMGVRIGDVRPGTASHQAGLKNGDILTRLGNVRVFDVASLVRSIRDRRPGDEVEIEYIRSGAKSTLNATLAGRNVSGKRAARFNMMNRLGAVPSRRNGNFPNVFQHDSPIFPEHCGGPITDLDGNVVGINIARRGRASSLSIPSSHIQQVIQTMLKESKGANGT